MRLDIEFGLKMCGLMRDSGVSGGHFRGSGPHGVPSDPKAHA